MCKRPSSLCHFVDVATVSLSFPPFYVRTEAGKLAAQVGGG
jgi:hypothetical protein